MKTGYQRPLTFEDNHAYLHLEPTPGTSPHPTRVTFVTYDPCPAFIIVLKPDGKYGRCSRDDLFTLVKPP